jgi:hypothetical protein
MFDDLIPSDTAKGVSAVIRGVAPYAAGAGAGFLMGGPPGAAAGAGAVALSDISAAALNAMGADIAGPTEATNAALDYAGLPRPETSFQRVLQAGAQGMTGGYTGAIAVNKMAEAARGPLLKPALTALGKRPGLQAASGLGSGVGGQTVKELGGGPLAQVAGSVAGGAVPLGFADFSSFLVRAQPRELAQEAYKAGYVLPPRMASAKPGVVSEALSADAGKIKVDQLASVKKSGDHKSARGSRVGFAEECGADRRRVQWGALTSGESI